MRWVFLPLLMVVVACGGRSDEEINSALAAERAAADRRLQEQQDAQNAAMAARDCADREARMISDHNAAVRRDREVIMTTLEAVSNIDSNDAGAAGTAFAIDIETLDPSEWRWVEVENASAATAYETASLRDRISYQLNPTHLSPRVQLTTYQGMPAVRFDCTTGNCMRAIGRRLAHYDGRDALQDIDERRNYNIWALGTANRAQVVRDALADLISRTQNPPRPGTCSSPGAPPESNTQ